MLDDTGIVVAILLFMWHISLFLQDLPYAFPALGIHLNNSMMISITSYFNENICIMFSIWAGHRVLIPNHEKDWPSVYTVLHSIYWFLLLPLGSLQWLMGQIHVMQNTQQSTFLAWPLLLPDIMSPARKVMSILSSFGHRIIFCVPDAEDNVGGLLALCSACGLPGGIWLSTAGNRWSQWTITLIQLGFLYILNNVWASHEENI